jgi:hypothetical protein
MIITFILAYILGCILAFLKIRQHNHLCDINKPCKEPIMSKKSALASWLYFIVEYKAFGIGELPDDLIQETTEEPVPDCSKHFNSHLF